MVLKIKILMFIILEPESDVANSLQGSASSIAYAYLDVRNLDDPENNGIILLIKYIKS